MKMFEEFSPGGYCKNCGLGVSRHDPDTQACPAPFNRAGSNPDAPEGEKPDPPPKPPRYREGELIPGLSDALTAQYEAYRSQPAEHFEITESFNKTAPAILKRAAQHLEDRAAARDQPGGERSMARTVAAFNALTGNEISVRDGWMFMVCLKAARACTTPTGLVDDYEDGAAYFGLAGESVS